MHAKTRILVVDDDTRLREAIREILDLAGYEVAEARNGIEALGIPSFYDVRGYVNKHSAYR